MRYCVVKDCVSWKQHDDNIKFFKFPKDPEIKKLWVNASGKKNVNFKSGTICSKHFTDNDWRLKDKLLNLPIKKRLLDPKAVPTVSVHISSVSVERANRNKKRTAKKNVLEAVAEFDLNQSKLQETSHTENIENQDPNKMSVEVQTEVSLECARELKIIELEKKLIASQKEVDKMKNENKELRNLETSVSNIFTSGQIKRLRNPNKKMNWSLDDISAATCLHSAGPRAYRFLCRKNFPLPGTSTLRQWARKEDSINPAKSLWKKY